MEQAPRLPRPTLDRQYVVVWRHFGLYLIKGFREYSEAELVYHSIIDILRREKNEEPEVYLMMLLAVYDDH